MEQTPSASSCQIPTCSFCTARTVECRQFTTCNKYSHPHCLALNALVSNPIFQRCPKCLLQLPLSADTMDGLLYAQLISQQGYWLSSQMFNMIPTGENSVEEPLNTLSGAQGTSCSSSSESSPLSICHAERSPRADDRKRSVLLHERARFRQDQQVALLVQLMRATCARRPPGNCHIDLKGDRKAAVAAGNDKIQGIPALC